MSCQFQMEFKITQKLLDDSMTVKVNNPNC